MAATETLDAVDLRALPRPLIEAGPARIAGALLAQVGGLVALAAMFGDTPWFWTLWVGIGMASGAIAGSVRRAWVVPLGTVGFYAVSSVVRFGAEPGPFWWLEAIARAVLMGIAFILGTSIGWTRPPRARLLAAWRDLSHRGRGLVAGAVIVALLGLGGYTGYATIVGSETFIHPAADQKCVTPAAFGWDYEAINYDQADDLRLAADNADQNRCSSQGSSAGSGVVTADGVRIAGWYIPAANGFETSGPTVLLVHGWHSNKSGMLPYVGPLHAAFNLVLIDLRNGGRSSGDETTMGVREALDVEAILDWLVEHKHPGWIGALGNSMGGATVLNAAATDPRIRAVVLESVHASQLVSGGNILETDNHQPALPGIAAIIAATSLRLGTDVTAVDPVRTITLLGDRPVLVLHGTDDIVDRPAQSAEVNFHAALDAGVPAEIHYCVGGRHGLVVADCPAWGEWVSDFLNRAIARDQSQS